MRPWSPAAALVGCLLAAGCGRQTPAGALEAQVAQPQQPGQRPSAPDALVVDERVRSSLKVDQIAARERESRLTIAGKVQFDEDHVARILAPLAGQVLDLRVKVGDLVHKGQPLCSINSRDVAAAVAEHIESHKDLDLAEKTMAMTQDLFDHQAASRIALQQAQNDMAKAQARVARTEESLRVLGIEPENASTTGRINLAAPLTGTVIDRKVTEGQFVQTDSTPLMTVADLSTVWVMGDVFERDLHLVALGRPATVSVVAYPGEQFAGRVEYISDTIDPATRTAKLRVRVPNPKSRLKPEMFASIAINVGDKERILTVPSSAAFIDNGRTWVYVAVAPNRFVRRPVDLGPPQDGERPVLSGLRLGDAIVVDGALLLRQEEEKRAS